MIEVRTRLLGLVFLTTFTLQAQVRIVNRTKETPRRGEITFNNDTTLTCDFVYNPLTPEGLLFVKDGDNTVALGIAHVKSFSFFDEQTEERRYFYGLPLKNSTTGRLEKSFFELIYPNDTISVLGRLTVKKKSSYIYYYNRTVRILDSYEKYLLDNRSGALCDFSKKNFLSIIDNKPEVMNLMYRKHYHLGEKDLDQYFELIDLYSKTKK